MIGPLFACAGLVALVAWRRLDVVEVRGRSMAPTLLPGDRLLAVRIGRPPRAGEVVLVPDPRDPSHELVKRVAASRPSGIALLGDNASLSTDGRTFGDVAPGLVRWVVALRYWPLRRVGRLPDAPGARATTTSRG